MRILRWFFLKNNLAFFIYLVLTLSIASVLFSMAVSSLLGILAFLAFLLYSYKYGVVTSQRNNFLFILLIFPFILTLINLLYTSSCEDAPLDLILKEINIVLFATPVFFIQRISKKELSLLLHVFSYFVLLAFLLSYIKGINLYLATGRFMYFGDLKEIALIQHNYLCLYGLFACAIWLKGLLSKRSGFLGLFVLVKVAIVISFIFFVSSRTAIILSFILFIGFVFFLAKERTGKLRMAYVVLCAIFFFGILIFQSPNTIFRFKRVLDDKNNPRTTIWRCSVMLVDENSTFFSGMGRSCIQENLNTCISSFSTRKDWLGLHAHNQILFFLLRFGYLQTFILVMILLYFFYLAIQERSFIFLILVSTILVFGLTEIYLTRRFGILYYSFFLSTFLKNKKI